MSSVLTIRLVVPAVVTQDEAENIYYRSIEALDRALGLEDDAKDEVVADSGFDLAVEDEPGERDGWPVGPLTPTMGGDCQLVLVGTEEDGQLAYYRCTVHSTDDKDSIVIGYDTYCEDA